MSGRDDGGPAFPVGIAVGPAGDVYSSWDVHRGTGLSLRDWFAGQALAGIMAQSHAGPKDWTHMGHGWGEDTVNAFNKHDRAVPATVADCCYAIADAMLASRNGGAQ